MEGRIYSVMGILVMCTVKGGFVDRNVNATVQSRDSIYPVNMIAVVLKLFKSVYNPKIQLLSKTS